MCKNMCGMPGTALGKECSCDFVCTQVGDCCTDFATYCELPTEAYQCPAYVQAEHVDRNEVGEGYMRNLDAIKNTAMMSEPEGVILFVGESHVEWAGPRIPCTCILCVCVS